MAAVSCHERLFPGDRKAEVRYVPGGGHWFACLESAVGPVRRGYALSARNLDDCSLAN